MDRFELLRRDPDAPEWVVAGAVYAGIPDRDAGGDRVWLHHPDRGSPAKYLAGLQDLRVVGKA